MYKINYNLCMTRIYRYVQVNIFMILGYFDSMV